MLAITRWWQASQRVVRPDFVVSLKPVVGDLAHFVERVEQVRAEHLFAVGPIETLDVRVLIGLGRLNETQLDVLLLAPVGEVWIPDK